MTAGLLGRQPTAPSSTASQAGAHHSLLSARRATFASGLKEVINDLHAASPPPVTALFLLHKKAESLPKHYRAALYSLQTKYTLLGFITHPASSCE